MRPSRLQAVLLAMSTYPSPHHPEWDARRSVITEGFTRCGGRMLPPLAKEKPEQAGEDRTAARTTRSARPRPGGLHQRQGLPQRARLREQPVRDRARATALRQGHRLPRSAGVRRQPGPARPAVRRGAGRGAPAKTTDTKDEPKPPGPMLAALQEPRPAAPRGAKDVPACRQACEDIRNQCVEAATDEANRCIAAIQSDPDYKACGCPNYPAGNVGCYHVCAGAYQRGDSCSAATLVKDCKTDGDRCRAQCE